MISQLWKNVNYTRNIPYLFSTLITEYDITKANINVLYKKGVIDKEFYNKLLHAPRMERQKTVGLMEREDKRIINILQEGIIEAKKELFESNNIQDEDVFSIRNDAVFILNRTLNCTKFGTVEFKQKETYSNYIRLNKKIEIYYGYFEATEYEAVAVKGLSKSKYLHEDYILDFILYILYLLDNNNITSAISSFKAFYDRYSNRELSIGYYREFNAASKYSIINQKYKASVIEDTDYNKQCVIDISYNLNILRQLYGYICDRFFVKNRF